VSVDPCIEGERAQQRNLTRVGQLLKVSRAASYPAGPAAPGPTSRLPSSAPSTSGPPTPRQGPRGRSPPPRPAAPGRPPARPQGHRQVAAGRGAARARAAPLQATTIPDWRAAGRAELIRVDCRVRAAAVNRSWRGDRTSSWTWEGWLSLATVIDIAARRVVGLALAERLRTSSSRRRCNAVAGRDPAAGVGFHADRGGHYPSRDYATLAGDSRWACRMVVPGSAGTTRWPSRWSPGCRASASASSPGRPGRPPAARWSSTSAGATARACPARWPPNPRRVRVHHQQGRHPAGSLTEPTALSAKPGHPSRAELLRGCCVTCLIRLSREAAVLRPWLATVTPILLRSV
jgi:hypothetical protein